MHNAQLKSREKKRSIRKMLPTDREVLLARLLLRVADALWEDGPRGPVEDELYNEVKAIAEGVIRHGDA